MDDAQGLDSIGFLWKIALAVIELVSVPFRNKFRYTFKGHTKRTTHVKASTRPELQDSDPVGSAFIQSINTGSKRTSLQSTNLSNIEQ